MSTAIAHPVLGIARAESVGVSSIAMPATISDAEAKGMPRALDDRKCLRLSRAASFARRIFSIVAALCSFALAGGYSDTHGDGATTGWTAYGTRTWSESGGFMLPQDLNGNTGFIINDYAATADGTFNYTLKVVQVYQAKWGGGVFRYIDQTHFYYIRLEEGDTSTNNAVNAMYLCTNTIGTTGCTTIKSSINFSGLGGSYPIKVVVSGTSFSFYLNNVFLATLTDATNATGKVGYAYSTQWSGSSYLKFDQSDWTDASTTYTWTGATSSDWGTSTNWSPAGVPGANDNIVVDKSGGATIALNGNRSVNNVTLGNSGTDVMTLQQGTSGTLTISSGGAVSTHASSTATHVISCPVTLSASMTTTVNNASGTLDIQGAVGGAFAMVKAGTGILKLSGTNTYSGATTINAGKLLLGGTSALGASSGVTVASGATLDLNGQTYVTSIPLTINGTGISSGGAVSNSSATASTYPGALTLGSSASMIASSGAITISNTTAISGSGYTLTLGGTGSASTLVSPIATGAGGLVKQDAGTWILQGASTYTGATNISAGILQMGRANAIPSGSDLTVTGTLDMRGYYQTVGSLSGAGTVDKLSGSGVYDLSVGGNNSNTTFSGLLKNSFGKISLTKTGTGTLTLSGTATFTGPTTVSAGVLKAGSTTAFSSGSAFTVTSTLDLGGYSNSVGSLAGAGTVDNTTGAGTYTLTAGADNTSTTFSGVLKNTSGTLAVTKAGTGTLTLSGTNTYGGATTVGAGTLLLGGTSALGASSGVSVTSGAALDLNGLTYVASIPLTLNGTGISSGGALINSSATGATYPGLLTLGSAASIIGGSGTINLSNTGTITGSGKALTLGGAQGGTLAGIIGTGTGTLTKQDAGTWTLSGASTFTGATSIGAGTLKLGATNALPSGSAVTISGTLDMNGFGDAIGSLAGAGTLDNLSGSGTYTLTTGADNTNTTFSGIIKNTSGTVAVSKTGTGVLTLSGNNTFSGGYAHVGGDVKLAHSNALGSAGASASNSGRIFLENGVNIGNTLTISACNAGVGHSVVNSDTGASATWSGTLNVNANCTYGGHLGGAEDQSGSLTISGPINMAGTATWVQQRDGVVVYGGGGNATRFDLLKGTARLAANNGLPSNARFSQSHAGYGSTLDLYGYTQTFQGIASLANTSTALTNSQAGQSTLTMTGSVDTIYSGNITGNLALVKSGTYTQTLGGTNTYTGSTTISAGTLKMGGASALPSTTALSVAGTLDLNANSETVASLTGAGIVDNTSSTSGTYTLTLGGDNTSTTFSGTIRNSAQSVALTKNGTGTFTLSGTNTFAGATTVSNGTLVVTGSSANSAVTVASGAVLGGTGTVGSTTAASGSTLSPGVGSAGTLSSGALTMASGSVLSVDLGTSSDLVAVTGNLSLAGTVNVTTGAGFGPGTYTLFTYTGSLTANTMAVGTIPAGYSGQIVVSGGNVNLVLTKSLTIAGTFTANNKTYDGATTATINANSLSLSGVVGADVVSLSPTLVFSDALVGTGKTVSLTGSSLGGADAAKYTLSLAGAPTTTANITAKTLTISGSFTASNKAYDGATTATINANSLSLSGVVGADVVSLSPTLVFADAAVGAGKTVSLTGSSISGAASSNYSLSLAGAPTTTASITAKVLTISGSFTASGKTYDGSNSATINTNSLSLSGVVGADVVTLSPTLVFSDAMAGAGKTVSLTGSSLGGVGASNYSLSLTGAPTTTATIAAKSLTIGGSFTANNKAFDNTTAATINVNSLTLVGKVGADVVTLSPALVFSDAAVGAGKTVSLTGSSLAGADAANYSLSLVGAPTTTASITSKTVTISGSFTASNKTYDGATTGTIATNSLSLSGVVGGDVVTLTPALEFSDALVGAGKTVSLTGSALGGANASSYTLSLAGAPTTTASITAKSLTISGSFTASNKTYDGATTATIATNSLSLSGVVGADVVTLSPALVFSDAAVGAGKTVSLTGSALGGANASSYTLSLAGAPTTTASITAKSLTISGSFTANDKAYDNTTSATINGNSLTLVGKVGADVVTLSPTLVFSDAAVGAGKTVSLTGSTIGGAGASNYSLSLAGAPTTTASITAKALTISGSFTASTKTYDGSTSASISTNSLSLSGVVGGETVTLTPVLVFSDAAVGAGKAVSLTGSSLGGADAANYTLSLAGAPTTTASITAKSLTISGSFTANDKAYENSTAATINDNSLTLVGKVGADVVTLSPTLVFSDAAVGAGKTVSLTGSSIGGAAASNYSLSLVGAPTTTASITSKVLTISGSFTASNKPYDGSTTASINANSLSLSGVVGGETVTLTPGLVFSDAAVGAGKAVSLSGSSLAGADAAKYTLSLAGAPTTTASITAKTLTIGGSFTANDKAYDNSTAATINGNSLTLVGKVGADAVTLSPTLVFSDAAVGTGKTVSLTGSSIGGAGASNYTLSLAGAPTTTASITAKALTISGSFTANDKTYDRNSNASINTNSLSLSGVVGGETVTLTSVAVFSDAAVGAGKTVSLAGSSLAGADAAKYTLSLAGAPTATASITAKALTISGTFSAVDKTYDGASSAAIDANGLSLGGVVAGDVVTLSPGLVFTNAAVGAGKTVALTASSLAGANAAEYSLSFVGAPTTTASITAKTLTIGGSFTANSKPFDNNTTATINVNSLTLVGKVGSDAVILNPTLVFDDAVVGAGKTVSLTGSSLSGADASNYVLSLAGAPTTTASITSKGVTISGSFTANDKIYDGTNGAVLNGNSLVLNGIVGGDIVTLVPNLVFDDAEAGAGKTVSLTGSTLGGANGWEYSISLVGAPTTTASITTKTLTIGGSFTANDKAFDNTTAATINTNSLSLTGVVGADDVSLSPSVAFANASVGNGKTVSVTGGTLGGAKASNYALSVAGAPTATASITAKTLTISGTFTAHDKTYDGSTSATINANSLTLSGVVGGDVVTLVPTLVFSDALAGSGKTVSLTGSVLGGADAAKYTLSLSGAPTSTATVTPKTLTVGGSFTAHDKVYDNSATATINANSLSLVGKVGADAVTLAPTLVFSDALAGIGKTVVLTGSVIGGADVANYSLDLTGAPTSTASITAKSLAVSGTFTAGNKTYDGTNSATIGVNSLALSGVLGGDAVTLSPTLSFADANVGAGKSVGLAGSSLGGANASNYSLDLTGAPTATANITAKVLTISGSFTANDKAFDNTTTATINANSLTLVGKVGADVVTLSPALVFSDAAVGASKTVSLTGSAIGGAAAANYVLSLSGAPTTTASITAKALTITGTFTVANKVYDGTTTATINSNSLALSGIVGGDVVTLSPALVFSDALAGAGKTVALTGSSLGGADAAKYTLSLAGAPTATASITVKSLTIGGSFTANDKAFDNTTTATINANSLTLVGKVGADVVTLSPVLVFDDAAVGAGKTVGLTGSSIGGADVANYVLSLAGAPTTTASITTKTLTISGTFTANDKTYDGAASASINANSLSLSGIVGGDVVTLSPVLVFADAAVGAGKTVSLTGSVLAGADASKYALSLAGAPTATASITAKTLTISGTFTANDKVFDNTTAATMSVNSLALSGKVGADVVTLSPTLVFSDALVGSGKTVSLTGSVIAGAGASNYELSLAGAPTTTASITTKTLTISGTFSANDKTYDGTNSAAINANGLSLSGVESGDVVTLSPTLVFADGVVGAGKSVSLAGSTLGGANASNYTLSLAGAPAATASILAKTLTISGTFAANDKAFDNTTSATISVNSLGLSGKVGADVVTLSATLVFSDAAVGAGKTVSLTGSTIGGAAASNYTLSLAGAPTTTASITTKTLTISGTFTVANKAYDGTTSATINANGLSLSGVVGADVVSLVPVLAFADAQVGSSKSVNLAGSSIAGANAANYTLSLAGAPTATASITSMSLTISGTFAAINKTYDGTNSATINTNSLSLTGVVGGDVVTLSPVLVFADAQVGAGKTVALTGSTLGGADAGKYSISFAGAPTTTASILSKTLTVGGSFTAHDKLYDRNATASINSNALSLAGVVGGDVVTLSPTLVFSDALAGSGKTVSLTGSVIAGAGASNYVLSLAGAPTTTASITAKGLTISGTFAAGDKIYDGTASASMGANTLSLVGILGGDVVTLGPVAVFSDAQVGTGKIVSLTGSTLGGANAGNYSLSLAGAPTATASITAKVVTVSGTFTASDKTYDGAANATINVNSLALSGVVGADVVTLSPVLAFSDAAVGVGKTVGLTGSTIGGAAVSNYTLSLVGAPTATASITTKPLTISGTFTAFDKAFDNTSAASINTNALALVGKVGSDAVTLSPVLVFADAQVGTGKTVSLTGSTLGGVAASNYSLSLVGAPTATASITPKSVTISGSFTANDKAYDGTTLAAIQTNSLSLAGVVGADVVTLSPVLVFADAQVGSGKTVSLTGSALGGADASKYSISFAGAPTTTAAITAKTITISPVAGQSKVYGDTDPVFSFTNSEWADNANFTGGLGRVAGASTGSYAFALGDLSAGANYHLTLSGAPVDFAINARPVTITANPRSKLFGDSLDLGNVAFTIGSGSLAAVGDITGVTLASAGAVSSASPGTYPIVPSLATGPNVGNYSIVYANGTLSVAIRPNQAPSFTKGLDQAVLEDAPARSVASWASSLTKGGVTDSVQTLGFRVSNSNPALFSVQPAVSSSGSLTYTVAAQANGVATVYVRLGDDGGTAAGGGDSSAIDSFTIRVTAVNDAPGFSKGSSPSVLENASAQSVANWATAISKGPADEAAQAVGFRVSNSNPSLFSAQPSVASNGSLSFHAAANVSGVVTVYVRLGDDGGTVNAGVDSSAIDSFTITVVAVNQAPSFAKGANQTILENAIAQTVSGWATSISKGPANEAAQSIGFRVSNSNAALFAVQPSVSAAGSLSYAPAPDANGLATVYVRLGDDGGTANGGVDSSAIDSFTISVAAVNQAPSFTKGANQTVLENAAPQSVAGWATNLSKGPANEASQILGFRVSASNPALFAVAPSISVAGILSYKPATNASGVSTVYVRLGDDGGAANGGSDSSAIDSFIISVTAVNQAPSFTKGANQIVLENAGAQSVAGWAATISVGPANESSQKPGFRLTASPANLFSIQPSISSSGTLAYTPAANAWGLATILVRIGDDGGTANGGVDSGSVDSFTIEIRHNLYPKIKPDTLRLRPRDSAAFALALRTADGRDSLVAPESGTWIWTTNLGKLESGRLSGLVAGKSRVYVNRLGRVDSAMLIVQSFDSAFTPGKDTVQVRVARGAWVTVPPRSTGNQITVKSVDTSAGAGIATASVTLKVNVVPADTASMVLALSPTLVDPKLAAAFGAPSVFSMDSLGKVLVVATKNLDTILQFAGKSGSSYWLGYDTVPVRIRSELDRDSLAGDTATRIDYSLGDNTSDAAAYLCVLQAGRTSPVCSLLVKSDSVNSEYSMPKSVIPLGARIWMEGRDSRSVTTTAARDIVVKLDTLRSKVVRQEDRYELLALPYTDGKGSIQEAYSRQFGAIDPTRWRVFRSDSSAFREVSATDSSTDLGKSFWVRTRRTSLSPWVSDVWTIPVSKLVQVALNPGWNMVGNPYPFDVAWSRIVDSSGFDASGVRGPYGYDPVARIWSTPDTTRTLKAWKGVAVYNATSRAIALRIPGIESVGGVAARAMAATNSFRLGIRGWQMGGDTTGVWVGIDSTAQNGLDGFDNPTPPVPSKALALALQAPVGARAAQSFFTDVRPMSDTGTSWSLRLTGLQANRPVSLGFARETIDSTIPVWIFDAKSGRWLEASGNLDFAVGQETSREFKVLVGAAPGIRPDMSRFGLASRAHGLAWYIPDGMGRTRVKIDLYDLRGRRVLSFVDEDMDPGIYSRDIAQVFALSRMVVVLDAGGLRKTIGTILTR